MSERYWIGGFLIDVSRNQITHNKQAQTLPPKALAVLTYLAERQGQVVSQDDLLSHVWKGTVVSPNTLQRCIAQLRKAFGDDGKAQGFIKTHAKKGYSLETDIRWEDALSDAASHSAPKIAAPTGAAPEASTPENATAETLSPSAAKTHKRTFLLRSIVAFSFVIVVVAAVMLYPTSSSKSVLQITDIRLLTSTDNRELASTYSPDGQYIVFQRFPEVMCQSHLWAKHIDSQREYQLTQTLGSYGSLSFSQDGKTLTFIRENNCTAPVEQKTCFHLQSLDFASALAAPQAPSTLMECKNTQIRSPIWTSDDTIALMQRSQGRWQLISYTVSQDKSVPLYDIENGNIVSFDFAPLDKIIAITSVHDDGLLYIEKLDMNGELVSSHPINFEGVIPQYSYIYPNFSPIQEHLIFSTGKQLFTVDFDGSIQRITLPLTDAMGTPLFHPFEKKMLAIKGHYDSDIMSVDLHQFSEPLLTQGNGTENVNNADRSIAYHTIVRTMLEENRAQYQPHGSLIAFSSEGDGTSQVWTMDTAQHPTSLSGESTQFSRFPTNTYVHDILWAQDGNSLLINASSQLTQRYLDGTEDNYTLGFPVRSLFHWDSEQRTVVGNILHQGVLKFVSIDLDTGEFSTLLNREVTWAAKTDSKTLVFTDHLGRFWKAGNIENEIISTLEHQGSDKHFIVKGETIYGVNDAFQLWRYSLTDDTFNILGQLPDTVDYITDINDHAILLTLRVAARKNVVELSYE